MSAAQPQASFDTALPLRPRGDSSNRPGNVAETSPFWRTQR